ncbi:MAG: hypothetical protein GX556_16030 [Fibrobacter sp.]|nr:hypothetical protein [Fibrobacter sp.]
MEQFLELLEQLQKTFTPHSGSLAFYRTSNKTRELLVKIFQEIRLNTSLYDFLKPYQPFQEIVQDARFSEYLPEIAGARGGAFQTVVRFQPISGKIPSPFCSNFFFNTLYIFEYKISTKLLELLPAIKDCQLDSLMEIDSENDAVLTFESWKKIERHFHSVKQTIINHAKRVLSHSEYETHFKKKHSPKHSRLAFLIPAEIAEKVYSSIHP